MSEELNHNKLLLLIDQKLREINHEIINPEIPELTIDEICPSMQMVARARADYLKAFYDLSKASIGRVPSTGEIQQLKRHRETYEELLICAKELQTAIERHYLDLKH